MRGVLYTRRHPKEADFMRQIDMHSKNVDRVLPAHSFTPSCHTAGQMTCRSH